MLTRDGEPFSVGSSRYHEELPADGARVSRVYVKVMAPGLSPFLALLDTGAPWCVFDPEIAEYLGLLGEDGESVRLRTRFGEFDGTLARTVVTVVADDGCGESLEIDATVFVSRDWSGGNFIGFNGLLERIRFAIDPDPQRRTFYFGELS